MAVAEEQQKLKVRVIHIFSQKEARPSPHKCTLLLDRDAVTGTEFTQSKEVDVLGTFDEMGLKEDLLRGVYAYGFEKPSAIQQRAIKPIILGRDVIAQSQSGTGKTAVFSIGALQVSLGPVPKTFILFVGWRRANL